MMDIIGGREKRTRNKKWILEEGRKKERKEGGMEGGREKERKKRKKKGGRNEELSKPEKHTQDSRVRDRLGRGFLTPASPARGPSAVDAGVLTRGATHMTAGLREPLPHSALQNFTPSC